MRKVFKKNGNFLSSATHLVRTKRGLIEAQNLKEGDVVIGITGLSKIVKIIKIKPKSNS